MPKILIVEDDLGIAESIGAALQRAGYVCRIEVSGENVLEIAKREAFDLAVVDVMLPITSGFEICRRIRRDPELYTMPILILSAMDEEEEVSHGLAQGADDYVVKPFDLHNLVQRIEALLQIQASSLITDSLTALPSGENTKRELQRKINRDEPFALCCVELVHLREFAQRFGPEARAKAIRHLGRALTQYGARAGLEEFFVGHMGGGYFMCILPPGQGKSFAEQIRELWEAHLQRFYESIGHGRSFRETGPAAGGSYALKTLDMLICITARSRGEAVIPRHLFETLSQLRNKAAETKGGGIFVDRRR